MPSERHLDFNGIDEKRIHALRTMNRNATENCNSAAKFSKQAVSHAVNANNVLPHASLKGKTPWEVVHGTDFDSFRVFCSIAFHIQPFNARLKNINPSVSRRSI